MHGKVSLAPRKRLNPSLTHSLIKASNAGMSDESRDVTGVIMARTGQFRHDRESS
ncbi:hypothetical protein HCU01_26550 [Halomonas cupida]|uniref:Uncharacterized protein n=1 Tax=Halomonas cupida TaxID=44933 RepID=A0A1M7C1B6_9GAMM|nr:hypothetical protein HCU01_26550 [Halomonas cupida]SHL60994.1 hypothetical protein SAMN05660971_00925 [Halomonas cupida]